MKLTKLEKELAILFLATSFGKMHIEDVIENAKNKEQTILDLQQPIKLLDNLTSIARLYSKKVDPLSQMVVEMFSEIEKENNELKPVKRFEKKVRLDSDGDIIINGLLFCVSLVLEHREIKNRMLNPNYVIAKHIHSVYENENKKAFDNARVLCKKFADKINKL